MSAGGGVVVVVGGGDDVPESAEPTWEATPSSCTDPPCADSPPPAAFGDTPDPPAGGSTGCEAPWSWAESEGDGPVVSAVEDDDDVDGALLDDGGVVAVAVCDGAGAVLGESCAVLPDVLGGADDAGAGAVAATLLAAAGLLGEVVRDP